MHSLTHPWKGKRRDPTVGTVRISAKLTPPPLWDSLPHHLGSHQRPEARNLRCQKLRKRVENSAPDSDYILALFNCPGRKGEQKGTGEIWF